jgi:surface antigen
MQSRRMLIAAAVAVALTLPAFAKKGHHDDDDDGHPGKGWAKGWDKKGGPRDSAPYTRFENSAERYRYEFRDASCRYKYEYSYRSGRSKVEQSGDCRGIAFPQRVVMQGREPLPRAIPPEPQASQIECNRDVIGAVLGGAVGAVVGSKVGHGDERVITTVGGAVIGAVVGGAVGKSMDDADQACAAQAMEYAGFKQSVRWHNPQRGAVYTITPVGMVPAAGRGLECRRYSMLTENGAMKEAVQGTACRQHDGSWRLSS